MIEPELAEFVNIEEQLKKVKENTKNLTTRKKELSTSITKCMRDNNVRNFMAMNGSVQIVLEEKKESKSVNKELVKDYIARKYGNEEAEKLAEEIFRNRPVESKSNLKVKEGMGRAIGAGRRGAPVTPPVEDPVFPDDDDE